jgi:ketosteroid isomerase-like protein
MGANEPGQMHELFAKFFNSQDVEGLVSLYEPDAALLAGPDQVARGTAEIREALGAFLALGAQIEFGEKALIAEAGDIALTHATWKLTMPDGSSAGDGRTAEVVRRDATGEWHYIVDNPWGTAPLDA